MATSGSRDYNVTRDKIIRHAALKIGVIRSDETMTNDLLSDFDHLLNAMVKRWSAEGIKVWTEKEVAIFLQSSTASYQLAAAGSAHATLSHVQTALTADVASGGTSLSVSSISGISDGDYIGIVVDDGTLHWDVVNGTPSGSTVTLTTGLDDTASSGAAVFAYTTKISRPLQVVDARRHDFTSNIDTPCTPPMSRQEYNSLPNKSSTGEPTNFYYDPGLSVGTLYIWPILTSVTSYFLATCRFAIEDFDTAGDNPDLPQEWISALEWNLAVDAAPEYEVPLDKLTWIESRAEKYLDAAMGFNREAESVMFGPDMEQ